MFLFLVCYAVLFWDKKVGLCGGEVYAWWYCSCAVQRGRVIVICLYSLLYEFCLARLGCSCRMASIVLLGCAFIWNCCCKSTTFAVSSLPAGC